MKVLVVGASGLVGAHCLNYLKLKNNEVLGTYRTFKKEDAYFFDPSKQNCFDFLEENEFKPDIIIHCAALTNADYCEDNEEESFELTVNSTLRIVNYCRENNIKLIYISTDYIFDGIAGPYLETAIPNPINIYGKHKLAAEKIVQQVERHLIIRVTNVYGVEERSKNFIARLLGLIHSDVEKEVALPYDQFATPIHAGDIAKMLYLLIINKRTGIYNFSSTDYYTRFQLAKKVQSYYNDSNHLILKSVCTQILQQRAKRPLKGGLLNNKFSNEFPDFEYTNIDKFILDIINNGIEI